MERLNFSSVLTVLMFCAGVASSLESIDIGKELQNMADIASKHLTGNYKSSDGQRPDEIAKSFKSCSEGNTNKVVNIKKQRDERQAEDIRIPDQTATDDGSEVEAVLRLLADGGYRKENHREAKKESKWDGVKEYQVSGKGGEENESGAGCRDEDEYLDYLAGGFLEYLNRIDADGRSLEKEEDAGRKEGDGKRNGSIRVVELPAIHDGEDIHRDRFQRDDQEHPSLLHASQGKSDKKAQKLVVLKGAATNVTSGATNASDGPRCSPGKTEIKVGECKGFSKKCRTKDVSGGKSLKRIHGGEKGIPRDDGGRKKDEGSKLLKKNGTDRLLRTLSQEYDYGAETARRMKLEGGGRMPPGLKVVANDWGDQDVVADVGGAGAKPDTKKLLKRSPSPNWELGRGRARGMQGSGSEPAAPQRNLRRYSENVGMGNGECAIGESMPRRIVKSYQEPRYVGEVGVYGKEAGPDLESARRLEAAATARGPSVAKRATEPVVMEAITTEESAPMMDLPVETETIGVLTTQAVSSEVPPTSLFLDTELPPRGTKSTQAPPPPPHLVASSTPATTTNHVIPGSTKLPCQRNNSKPSTCEATSPACHPENGPALRPYETFVGPDETDSEYRDALMGKLGEAIVDAILAKSKKHRHHLAVCSKVDPDSAEMARNALALAMGGCKKAEEQAKKVRQDALARFGQILEALPLSSESKCHRLPPDLKEYLKSLMTGPAEGEEEEEGEKTPPEVVSAPKRELTSWREPVLPYLFSQGPVWVEPPNNVGDWLEDQQYEDHFPDTRLSYPE